MRLAAALCLCLACAAPAQGAQYPDDGQNGGGGLPPRVRAACLAVADAREPGSAPGGAPASCDALAAYYAALDDQAAAPGPDWAAVRACALASGDHGVLMMLHANGLGIPRDLRLAMRHACALGGAPAELEGRVEHLSRLMAEARAGRAAEPLDLCDDITSGYMQGLCADIASRREAAARGPWFDALAARLAPAQRPAWERLMRSLSAFAEARAELETDLTGTARAALAIAARDAEHERCREDLERFEAGELPGADAARLAVLDVELNELYRAVMRAGGAEADGRLDGSSVERSGVRATQKLWLRYRDAWVAFGLARYPSVSAEAWAALATARRVEQLRELAGMAGAED